jgi:hypothetical protein
VVFVGLRAQSKTVYQKTVRLSPAAASGSAESVFISEPFSLTGRGNLEVRVNATLDNSWLYVDGAVASTTDETVGDFDMEAGFYRGVDEGTSWSEGSGTASAFVGLVPPGQYALRLAPQWGAVAPGAPKLTDYHVEVRRSVPHVSYLLIACVLILLWPVLVTIRSWNFETARWSESDHA